MRGAEGRAQKLLAAADFGLSGEEGQDISCFGFMGFPDIMGYQLGDVFRRGFLGGMLDFYREHAAFALDDGGLQFCGQCLRVNGSRHNNDSEVFPQERLRLPRKGQSLVAVDAALMEFVKDNGRYAIQGGILDEHARKDTLCDNLDAGIP